MQKIFTFLLILIQFSALGQSVFSNGEWYKVGITESGIYKLDYSFLVNRLDIPSSIDPRTLRVYGIAGGMLPQENAIYRPNDPVEIPVLAHGPQGSSLDREDYFLFYGEGPHKLSVNADGTPNFETNLYSDTAYFFITYGQVVGKRISSVSGSPSGTVTSSEYTEYQVHELEDYNLLKSGREWLGEQFRKGSNRTRKFEFQPLNSVSRTHVWLKVASSSEGTSSFDVELNGENLGNVPISAIPGSTYGEKIKYSSGHFVANQSAQDIELKLSFNASEGNSLGYLDQIIVGMDQELALQDDQTIHIHQTEAGTNLSIKNASSESSILDVHNPTNPSLITGNLSGNTLAFLPREGHHKFIIFNVNDDFEAPLRFGRINNQNIKSLSASDAMIITHPKFLHEANRLANFHMNEDGMSIGVVTTQQIYNEFSGGRQDITAIRDFLKYSYENIGMIRQALLFGDASYDYKYRIANNTNYVPVYESRESSNNLYSHSSDDYFGFFDESEGYWKEDSIRVNSLKVLQYGDNDDMEIGIGRLPVRNEEEAKSIVDKIISYKTSAQQFGKWRNQIAYFADDGDNNIHMTQAESLYQLLDTIASEFRTEKIYLDLYDQRVNGTNSKTTGIIKNTLKEGVFMFNYIGHGNEGQLTSENVINLDVINSLTNGVKMPLFITATCEFGKYDNPLRKSGAEYLLFHENGGAIALLTTTRAVYASTNFPLNQALHENLFFTENGKHLKLGEVIRRTKNEALKGSINRNFALLGDPMLTLNYPELQVNYDGLNGSSDTLSALENYQISGHIGFNDQLFDSFNGKGILTLYDVPQNRITKGQESDPFLFEDQNNALFRGEISITNGSFAAEMILPKNISYDYKPGKITLYAWDETNQIDASGSNTNFVLGGTSENLEEDNTSPIVNLFLNEDGFQNGQTVGPNSLLIARISDESGLNISNDGINQGLTLALNDGTPVDLNQYYTASKDTYKEGTLIYPLQNLAPGQYTATLKVLDAHNNLSVSTVDFKVSDQSTIRLFNLTSYPNPASLSTDQKTTIAFEHDREDENLEVQIKIYNMNGEIMRTIYYDVESSPRNIDNLEVPLYDHNNIPMKPGVYLFAVGVSSTLDNATNQEVKRLIIIN